MTLRSMGDGVVTTNTHGRIVLLNGAVGVVPIVGEAFSFWYRPSSRNYNLLLKHAPLDRPAGAQPATQTTTGEWVFVIGLLVVVLIVMGLFIGLGIHILVLIWHALGGSSLF